MPNGHGGRRNGAGASSNNQRHGPARRGHASLLAYFPHRNAPIRAEAEKENDQAQHQQVEEESAQQEVEVIANIELELSDGVVECNILLGISLGTDDGITLG
jgi:hypothetical protein